MTRPSTLPLVFLSGFLVGTAGIPRLAAQRRSLPGSQSRILLKTDLTGCNGREVSIEMNELSPGTSGKHYHPGESFTYVLDGSEVYEIQGQPSKVVKAGDVLHEAPMQVHTVDNAKPVKLLVIRVAEKGRPDTVWIDPRP